MVQGARYRLPNANQHRFASVSRRIDLAGHATGTSGSLAEFQNPVTERSNTMANTSREALIVVSTLREDKAVTAAAKGNPDAQPLTPKQLKARVPLRMLRVSVKSATDGNL